ncbi:MAG: flagellar basal body rod protein FlgB [Thauera sp.]|nr:flagellar basal body rod protein FlgB [Thauera sp.]
MRTLLDKSLRFHHTAFNLQAYRQELLASNIANADTPHFKARDIDFGAALNSALGRVGDGSLAAVDLDRTHRAHIEGGAGAGAENFAGYRTEFQSAVDGNTVSMDVERAAIAQNSLHYEASLTFISGMFRTMGQAISGQ